MFGGNNKKENTNTKSNSASTVSSGLNSLVKGTVVEGTVKSESDIRIDGTIKGKLVCDAKVIIGPTGYVEGEIRCQNAVVEGKFEGTLEVSELLNVRESAVVSGEVSTEKLIVQSGATFNVTCSMGAGTARRNGSGVRPDGKTADRKSASNVKENKAAGAQS
ncbi:bactofilin family protein [Phaeodactylibacter xiamenensis]|jgi:cytoskeletal protein CcmA (bactofilin family)|uniref:bactofilin family protein n=1 Tax=Phaeodactylibacter xiamenensis TaxID=1524460 RepID=UPI0024A8CC3A|nr:polymer-forming cytoskeletal protein [Phaeodactylibacter xiamenensis]